MKNGVLFKVLLAIVLAFIVGWLVGPHTEIFGITYVKIFGLIGQLFLNALTLVIVPLVAASIITGVAKIGSDQSFGNLGAKTFGYFFGINLLAILIGIVVVLMISPGTGMDLNLASQSSAVLSIEEKAQGDMFDKVTQILFRIVPSNIIAVASQGQMLGLIGFCLLFGFFITKIEEKPAAIMLGFWKAVFQIMMRITHLVMLFLPLGVFALVAKVVATTGVETIKSMAIFGATVLLALAIFAFIALPLLLAFVARVNPLLHFRAVAPALLTAFSTSSTAATLPVTIECVEKRACVSNRVCSFVLPLATSLNLSGSSLYMAVSVPFIAQAYGMELTAANTSIVILMSFLLSMGMAGIPSGALVSIVLILHALGLPAEGIGLVLAVERILDMCRSTVSVLTNTCSAVLVARSEGEKEVLATVPLSIHERGQ